MTQAKYATVLSALATNGYAIAEAGQRSDGEWFVIAYQPGNVGTNVATVNTFATNQGITAIADRAYLV